MEFQEAPQAEQCNQRADRGAKGAVPRLKESHHQKDMMEPTTTQHCEQYSRLRQSTSASPEFRTEHKSLRT